MKNTEIVVFYLKIKESCKWPIISLTFSFPPDIVQPLKGNKVVMFFGICPKNMVGSLLWNKHTYLSVVPIVYLNIYRNITENIR